MLTLSSIIIIHVFSLYKSSRYPTNNNKNTRPSFLYTSTIKWIYFTRGPNIFLCCPRMHRRCQCILRIQLLLTQTSVYNLNVLLLDHWFNNKAMCNWCSYIKMPLSTWDNLTIGVKKKKKKREGSDKRSWFKKKKFHLHLNKCTGVIVEMHKEE